MELRAVQYCYSTEGWSPVHIPSHSVPDTQHMVLVNPHVRVKEFVCDCFGFQFRGTCRHQTEALDHVCWWPLVSGKDVEQSAHDQRDKRCPQCGGPTKWEMVEVEDG